MYDGRVEKMVSYKQWLCEAVQYTPEAACLSGWVPLLSFPVTSPRPSFSVCTVWQLLGSFPETFAASRLDLRPPPACVGLPWAVGAVLSEWAAFAVLLVRAEPKRKACWLSRPLKTHMWNVVVAASAKVKLKCYLNNHCALQKHSHDRKMPVWNIKPNYSCVF